MTFLVMLGAPRMSPGQREQVKLNASARALVVGEAAGYQISADLPKGARKLWINDTIPRGLIYDMRAGAPGLPPGMSSSSDELK